MSGRPQRRVPLAPLERLIAARWPDLDALQLPAGQTLSNGHIARVVGSNAAQVGRARRDGTSWRLADEWAIAVGVHPAELWPDMFGPYAA